MAKLAQEVIRHALKINDFQDFVDRLRAAKTVSENAARMESDDRMVNLSAALAQVEEGFSKIRDHFMGPVEEEFIIVSEVTIDDDGLYNP